MHGTLLDETANGVWKALPVTDGDVHDKLTRLLELDTLSRFAECCYIWTGLCACETLLSLISVGEASFQFG